MGVLQISIEIIVIENDLSPIIPFKNDAAQVKIKRQKMQGNVKVVAREEE